MNDQQDIIYAGTVTQAESNKALVKVNVLGRQTDWLPVLQQANAFKRQWIAPRVGQQVLVLANRYVIGCIFNKGIPEPIASHHHNDITEYEDGTRIEYDTDAKQLTINAVGNIIINTATTLSVTSTNTIDVSANTVNITGKTGDMVINGISFIHHTHPQNAGDHFGGAVNTNKPNQSS